MNCYPNFYSDNLSQTKCCISHVWISFVYQKSKQTQVCGTWVFLIFYTTVAGCVFCSGSGLFFINPLVVLIVATEWERQSIEVSSHFTGPENQNLKMPSMTCDTCYLYNSTICRWFRWALSWFENIWVIFTLFSGVGFQQLNPNFQWQKLLWNNSHLDTSFCMHTDRYPGINSTKFQREIPNANTFFMRLNLPHILKICQSALVYEQALPGKATAYSMVGSQGTLPILFSLHQWFCGSFVCA